MSSMKSLSRVEAQLHSSLTSVLDTDRFTPSTQRKGDRNGPRTGQDILKNEKTLALAVDQTPNHVHRTIVTVTTTPTGTPPPPKKNGRV